MLIMDNLFWLESFFENKSCKMVDWVKEGDSLS